VLGSRTTGQDAAINRPRETVRFGWQAVRFGAYTVRVGTHAGRARRTMRRRGQAMVLRRAGGGTSMMPLARDCTGPPPILERGRTGRGARRLLKQAIWCGLASGYWCMAACARCRAVAEDVLAWEHGWPGGWVARATAAGRAGRPRSQGSVAAGWWQLEFGWRAAGSSGFGGRGGANSGCSALAGRVGGASGPATDQPSRVVRWLEAVCRASR
jgi:hypothetical protein